MGTAFEPPPGLFIALGLLLLVVAAGFGFYTGTYLAGRFEPTYSPAGAACGFAIAGGLSFVAAALAMKGRRNGE